MKIIKMNNRDRASRRLYSYLLVGETTCKETPHFQWIYRKLSQIYKKLRSDQMDPKSVLGGPKPIWRTWPHNSMWNQSECKTCFGGPGMILICNMVAETQTSPFSGKWQCFIITKAILIFRKIKVSSSLIFGLCRCKCTPSEAAKYFAHIFSNFWHTSN